MSDINSLTNIDFSSFNKNPLMSAGLMHGGALPFMSAGSIFYQPIMPQNISFSSNIFPQNFQLPTGFAEMFEANLQQNAWNGILKILASYKPPKIDMSMLNLNNDIPPLAQNFSDSDTSNFSYDAKELKSKWAKKAPHLSDAFYSKATAVAKRLGCDPNDLLAVMYSESGIKPGAVNKNGGATGIIQFMPKTAQSLGTTTAALKNMTAEEQLVYVEKYLAGAKKSAGYSADEKIGAGTLYALIFLPARARREVLTAAGEGTAYYRANRGLDSNGDEKITKNELASRVQGFMA